MKLTEKMKNPTAADDRLWEAFLYWAREKEIVVSDQFSSSWEPWWECYLAGAAAGVRIGGAAAIASMAQGFGLVTGEAKKRFDDEGRIVL